MLLTLLNLVVGSWLNYKYFFSPSHLSAENRSLGQLGIRILTSCGEVLSRLGRLARRAVTAQDLPDNAAPQHRDSKCCGAGLAGRIQNHTQEYF